MHFVQNFIFLIKGIVFSVRDSYFKLLFKCSKSISTPSIYERNFDVRSALCPLTRNKYICLHF